MGKERNKVTVAGIMNINSVQSSLKSYSLCVTLYEMYIVGSEFSSLWRTAVDVSYIYTYQLLFPISLI